MSLLISVVKYLIFTVQNNLVMSIFHHGQFRILPLLPGGDLSLGGMVISWRGTWASCWPLSWQALLDLGASFYLHTAVADGLSPSVASCQQATHSVSSLSHLPFLQILGKT